MKDQNNDVTAKIQHRTSSVSRARESNRNIFSVRFLIINNRTIDLLFEHFHRYLVHPKRNLSDKRRTSKKMPLPIIEDNDRQIFEEISIVYTLKVRCISFVMSMDFPKREETQKYEKRKTMIIVFYIFAFFLFFVDEKSKWTNGFDSEEKPVIEIRVKKKGKLTFEELLQRSNLTTVFFVNFEAFFLFV